jgi:hypothetical protein
MTRIGGFGLTLAEKFFGVLLIIIGVVTMYYSFMSGDILGAFTRPLGLLGFAPLILGLFLLIAKTE